MIDGMSRRTHSTLISIIFFSIEVLLTHMLMQMKAVKSVIAHKVAYKHKT